MTVDLTVTTSGIVDGNSALASGVTTPLLQIKNHLDNILNGVQGSDAMLLNYAEVTIASGAITLSKTLHRVDTEADAASDDLVTINNLAHGQWCIIRAESAARDVVIKHGTDNILTTTGVDITLDDDNKLVLLLGKDGSSVIAAPLFKGGIGNPSTITLASDVLAAGKARNVVVAAEAGVADDLIEITGLAIGEKIFLRADTGDTITVRHDSVSATNKIHIFDNADFVLDEHNPLELVQVATNVLAQMAV